MHVSENGLHMIERFEGFVDHQYNDGTGVMTVGYGTTSADISPLPRFLTQAQAEQLLRQKLAHKYEPAVDALNVPLTQNEFDALVSLTYNCGPGAMQWQIGRELRARNYAAAADCFGRYVVAGGRVLRGLVTRRAAERALFLTPATSNQPQPPQSDAYEIFADSVFTFSRPSLINIPAVLSTFDGEVLGLNERATVRRYDGLVQDPTHNDGEIHRHQVWLLVLRKRIWWVAHNPLGFDNTPTWDVGHRGARWQALSRRTINLN
jgi:GH24 family phage-related lysozyme (muramidase)